MTERHIQIKAEDVDKARALIHRDRPYKIITDELVDRVLHPVPKSKTVYKAPPGKALIIIVNPRMPEGDEPKDVDANQWYASKFQRNGIAIEWVRVTYL